VCAALLGLVLAPAPAAAELVYMASGRVLFVDAIRSQGDALVLHLRSGGELVVPQALIDRVEPDDAEVPEEVLAALPAARALREPPAVPEQYRALIAELSARHGVDARLVHAVVEAESGYHSRAVSPKGAQGLMQLMPSTGRIYGALDLFDPAVNLDAGIRHLRMLLDRFELPHALAAYNAGEAAVQRFGGIPPFAETRGYVARVVQTFASLGGVSAP
jgi:soluble lytic murein transglycosylase-like protein